MGTSVKPYPCCRYSHGCIELLLELAGGGLAADDVESVRCAVLRAGWHLVAEPRTFESAVDAQFSLPFAAAVALAHRRFTLAEVEAGPQLARGLSDLIARVECVESERLEAAFPAAWGAEVEVRTRAGDVLVRSVATAPGSPERPLSGAALRAKAASLIGAERAAGLLAACTAAIDEDPVAALTSDIHRSPR
jgi:2-methylcitrate dehydratase PrpD